MAADSKPPPPNPVVQRAANYQGLAATGLRRLVEREDQLVQRLLDLAAQEDNLPTALSATKDALDRIQKHYAGLSGQGDDRECTDEELREAEAIAERVRAKKGT